MNPIDAKTIAQVTGGELVLGSGDQMVSTVSTDTRSVGEGDAFFALRGDRFDANDFAPQAAAAGAAVVVVERWDGGADACGATVIKVGDGLLALQRLARWQRLQMEIPVVGITGSNGKTSTKDFTRAVLARKYDVFATRGNLNNHIGVPLTLLALTPDHGAAVVEMGMNHAGEIAPLCEIAMPTMGVITNIGTAHIEYLGSRQGIAEEKGALARALPSDGLLFVPAGCDFYDYFKSRTKARVVPVGNGRGLIRAEHLVPKGGRTRFTLVIEDKEVAEVDLPSLGRHMVKNALLAAGCGWFLGIDPEEIACGLSTAELTSGRLRRYESSGITVYDDTYNANPESMSAAIETLAETPVGDGGRRFAVLGPMGELGGHGPEAHLEVGRLAASRGVAVISVGEGAEGIARGAGVPDHIPDGDAASSILSNRFRPGDVVLFKASRSAAMEKVMNRVCPPNN
ncbi:UDP-N-acetylmuramoyl-tripeptide--D-alanyl-D-alanine ligase [Haloferula helveola]|uniref:UDP-N-acetylmuramoyl-tripeptide--D-alanyl-D-alanine ligase n=1 Tax=Haloferula helveola TaxID=490095 RepID=A0ABN6H0P1_9BACT|nr:UDP-N-acetylmuramoyl-tripeptide--D-alanyl-D-alanine ligase [Haloferula helveola]